MKNLYFAVWVLVLFSCNSKEKEKVSYIATQNIIMAAPILKCDHFFFTDSVEVSMNFSLPKSTIKYTLDGAEVTDQSKTYTQPIFLKKTTNIKAKNFHPEFQSSVSTALKVIRTNTKLKGSVISLTPPPAEQYQGKGVASLTDHKKGTMTFANDTSWLGFQSDSISITIDFLESRRISKISLSTLTNHGAWIFLPKSIKVFSGTKKLGSIEVPEPSESDLSQLKFIEIPIKEEAYKHLKIVVTSLGEIPEWHQGKGTLAWFFTDEILVE